ncbi:hypothetical protein CNX70_00265 [Janthinobacterium svalbardensis]|uniref:Uncharacterized protein n=1 Tax=Janthinobacterium svalbardensis TaxID=368607 RepID=A0A290WPL8_9BURK|nr:hypothetical protein [Janthinobacterium svalbardensis]ATD58799.1 hypothetical protein CNX70_00265 [Janthinobacterium svalbardensis]
MNKYNQNEDIGIVVGTLLEMAIRDQKAVRRAVERLSRTEHIVETAAAQLPATVAREVTLAIQEAVHEVADVLVRRFDAANIDAKRASVAYQEAAKFGFWRMIAGALGVMSIFMATIVFVAWLAMPNISELQARRDEKAYLEAQITLLEKRGAKIDYTICELTKDRKKTRLCARIDPSFVDKWDGYRILAEKRR